MYIIYIYIYISFIAAPITAALSHPPARHVTPELLKVTVKKGTVYNELNLWK